MHTVFELPPPPGFQGLDPHKPITGYVRHLPHWRQEGATYFVTFRLHDSLPHARLKELRQLRRDWEQRHRPPHDKASLEKIAWETMRRVENWLDRGSGRCWLKDPMAAKRVADALRHFDGQRYELGCFVVMPNHAHVIVRPLDGENDPLERILQSWKRHSSNEINQLIGRSGSLWQEESFDRIIRDAEHLYRAIQYIGDNPAKAFLQGGEYVIWIRPAWNDIGWGFALPTSGGVEKPRVLGTIE